FIGEEIPAGELEVVQGALDVEEKGIAAPAHKEAVVPDLRQLCLPAHRNRNALGDNLSALACAGGLCALNAAQRRGLAPSLVRRETYLVGDVRGGIAIRVDH